jgi:thiol-disulfide isomerase/thioredoxin
MNTHHLDRAAMAQSGYKPEKPGIEYYSFLNGLVDDYMAYLPEYPYLINQLLHIDVFTLPGGQDKPVNERFAYFKEKISPLLGSGNNVFFDVALAQMHGARIQEMDFFTDAEKQTVRGAFGNPAIADILIAENDRTKEIFEAAKNSKESIVHETPRVSDAKLFDAILAEYKGKVVLVDFWATWCVPCIQAHKKILPLKEELKGKEVVFLYLTGETSPLANYTRMYPEIHGEHYRVSNAQWSYWYESFGIQGIPTYFIYDKQGKQTYRAIGFPGVETMRNEINKVL